MSVLGWGGVGVEFKLSGVTNNSHSHFLLTYLMVPFLFSFSFSYKNNFDTMSQVGNLGKAVFSSETCHVNVSSQRKMEKCAFYSGRRKCSQMFQYGKYVIKGMFYENEGEEIVDLEGRKTGGKEISQNTFNRRYIRNQGLN